MELIREVRSVTVIREVRGVAVIRERDDLHLLQC